MTIRELIDKLLREENQQAIVHVQDRNGHIAKVEGVGHITGEIYSTEHHLSVVNVFTLKSDDR